MDLDAVLDGGGLEEETTIAAAGARGGDPARRDRGGAAEAPTNLPPARAQLRAALAPAHPVEVIDVRAQGSRPVAAPSDAETHDTTIPAPRRARTSPPQFSRTPPPPQPQPLPPPPSVPRPLPPAPQMQPRRRPPTQPPSQQPPPRPAQPPAQLQPPAPAPDWRADGRPVPYPGANPAGRGAIAPMPGHVDPRARPPGDLGHGTPPGFDPRIPRPIGEGYSSQPYLDPRAMPPGADPGGTWQQLHYARRRPTEGVAFDAGRDATVRRIVWALVIVLGGVLLLVVAKLL
jgi:hypothetical protein